VKFPDLLPRVVQGMQI